MPQPAKVDPSMALPLVAPLQREPRRTTSASPPKTPSLLSRVPRLAPTSPSRRILGIDIENKPLWYGGGDFVYDNVICITPKYVGEPCGDTIWLDWSHTDRTLLRQLAPLREMIDAADALLGHNFRHDWKGIQSVFNHLKQPFLPKRTIVDTMRCIPSGMPRSLEWLCDTFDLGEKPHVSQRTWVDAIERKDPEAIATVMERNRADVLLTERLYEKELDLGWITARVRKAA
jgi:hypothetical protein